MFREVEPRHLSLSLLGSFQITLDGILCFKSNKAKALLAYR
jgi:DNA-binding SARP family transcriptional activator